MNSPRLMLAAPGSGSGKTMITCGLLQALVNRGLKVASFKCGPDYIDPLFHEQVIGAKSGNLDLFFSSGELMRYLFTRRAADRDISIIEGVMGYYDGMSAASSDGSSWHVAKELSAPVVLIVNSRGQSVSALATLYGFLHYQENSRICGVIFNQMSQGVYEKLKDKVAEMGVEPLGYVPKSPDLVVESRYLGLVAPEEVTDLKERLQGLAQLLEKTVNLDRLLELSRQAPELDPQPPVLPPKDEKVTVAVARDEAFTFLYQDNLALLEELGAEIVPFSPMRDKALPKGTKGILLCGGYPERFAKVLSENTSMLDSIRHAIQNGVPCLAECGGFLYLHQELMGDDGQYYPMAGIIPARAYKTSRLGRFGYIALSPAQNSRFLAEGETAKGHEFHYYESESCGESLLAVKPLTGKSWQCCHQAGNLLAGFPHFFYYSNPNMIKRFLDACREAVPADGEEKI